MMGCYDFCGHYEWTFEWLRQQGGDTVVKAYWDEAIHQDSQRHASALIRTQGIEGMKQYWGVTLEDEGGTHHCTATDDLFRIDIHECPSKGFLLRNGLQQHRDYCDHCLGWIGPMMKRAGFVIDHEHNHRGQCWWEMRRKENPAPASAPGAISGKNDTRLRPDWAAKNTDHYERATDPDEKVTLK
jgi:hypothetical protein